MKKINFGKIKEQLSNFLKPLAFWNKKKYSEGKTAEGLGQEPTLKQNFRRGGYKYYTHILKPLNNHKKAKIYRSFNKQKLAGAIIIFKNTIYRIEKNPAFGH